jgi:hypothetical protein
VRHLYSERIHLLVGSSAPADKISTVIEEALKINVSAYPALLPLVNPELVADAQLAKSIYVMPAEMVRTMDFLFLLQ